MVPPTPVISYDIQEGSPKFPAQEGVRPHMVPTHVVNANVGIFVYIVCVLGFFSG